MICYLESKSDTVLKICSAEKFAELTEDQRTAVLIDAYRSGQNPGAKSMLPAFVFQGYDPALLEGKRGSRKKSALKPTGLVMHDFDHIGEVKNEDGTVTNDGTTPQDVYDRFLKIMPKLGLTLEHDLALAHITPSGKGLRLVLRSRKNRDVAEDQKWIADALGVECDVHVKDLSRLSFVPKREDILYLNKSLLFADVIEPSTMAKSAESTAPSVTSHASVGDDNSAEENRAASTTPSFPETYNGIPYKRIVEELITVHGGEPQVGNRENTLFLIAGDMAKITDRSQTWLESLLPTFGLPEEEWRTTIAQVCKKPMERGLSRKLQEAIKRCKDLETDQQTANSAENLPPKMPENLPSLVKLLTSKVLPHQRPAVAAMIFPALAVHVNNCLFKLRDNTDVELSLMCCLLAQQSVGKGCVKPVLKQIMADIKAQDRINRERERAWQESQKNKKANEKGQSKPEDLVIRYLSSDTTPAAFLGRLFAAEHGDGTTPNLCTYSQVDEIEDLYRFCASGGKNMVQQMIKRTWDRDDIGAERFTANAANIATVLRWNWAACSTIENGKDFFSGKMVTDGAVSRVDFCTIIPPAQKQRYQIARYDKAWRDKLAPYVKALNDYRCETDENGDLIPALIPESIALEEYLDNLTGERNAEMVDDVYEDYSRRCRVMTVKKMIVLYIAHGCKWLDSFDAFARWMFDYSMWAKMAFFYDKASEAFRSESVNFKGNWSPLKMMRRQFTFASFSAVCQRNADRFKGSPMQALYRYKNRGIITQEGDTYTICEAFCKKHGIN